VDVSRLRILIADDESIIRMGLKTILEELGYEVIGVAADGEEAVELARRLDPDLAILDIKMPKMDGLQAARAIISENPIPIVILTAYSDRELVERAKEAMAMAYLVKPIRENELVPAIEIAVSRFEEWERAKEEKENLQEALESRAIVEKAKRHLMEKKGLREQEAFMFIHRRSRDTRRSMREVAEEILRS